MPLRYKTKTLGELQQEKAITENDLREMLEIEDLWKQAYSQGFRDGIRLARKIVFGEGKTDD